MSLIDMSLSIQEKKEMAEPTAITDRPDFPYGLKIHLGPEEMKKLGLDVPKVGETMGLVASVEVTDVSSNKGEDDVRQTSMSLQITGMRLSEGSPEKPEAKKEEKSTSETLFGG